MCLSTSIALSTREPPCCIITAQHHFPALFLPPLLSDSPQVGRLVPDYVRSLVATVAPHTQQLVAALGVPDGMVEAPIAFDWTLYNTVDNCGELIGPAFAPAH